MSSSVRVIAAAAFSIGVGFACSSSTSSTGTGNDPDASAADPTGDAGATPNEPGDAGGCLKECLAQHPNAPLKLDAVDQCVGMRCSTECQGDLVDAGPDAGLCGTTFPSGSPKACDDCITTNCCTAWTGCFGDTDCLAYDDCLSACPEE